MRTLIPFVIVLLLLPSKGVPNSDAYPHVFVANRLRIVFDDEGLTGIHVKRGFDKYFNQMIADEFDAERDGALQPSEVAIIKKETISHLANSENFSAFLIFLLDRCRRRF